MKTLSYSIPVLIVFVALSGCNSNVLYDAKEFLAVGIILLIAGLFLMLSMYSNLIRDEISNCDVFEQKAQQIQEKQKWIRVNKKAPFSLTKVQFGLWTVIIASSYIYLSLFKGDCATAPMNKTALVLMGICAGTAVASTIMDKSEMNDNRERHQNSPSQGFFIDILSDDNGISLHRFQNLAWTIIAITVYLYKVSLITTGCAMPELSDTLLALTGISSVTYLTLKSKENDPPVQQIVNTNAMNNPNRTPAPSASPAPLSVLTAESSKPVPILAESVN